LGGCYEPANLSLSQEQLSELGRDYFDGGCTDGACDCPEPPSVACLENLCTLTDAPPVESCEDREAEYAALVEAEENTICQRDEDCRVLTGQCGVGLGGCYEVVNVAVSQDELDALGAGYSGDGCTGGACDCAEPPEAVCEQNTCVAALVQPPGCTQDDPPVCGTDGVTYANHCEAEEAGQAVLAEGTCRYCDGEEGSCGEGEVCYSLDGLCGDGAFAGGTCGQAQLEGCQSNPEPVCGCDGTFYTSHCEALSQGVGVSRFGGCQEEGQDSYSCYDRTCGPLQACNISANDVAGEGEPEFFVSCVDLTGPCSNQPSCDLCYPDLGDFVSCSDGTGNIILYSPGG
jgi:hypothetical protein